MFFSKNSGKFATSPSAAIGCTENYQPIGVTVHSYCDVGEGGVAVNCEKPKFFPEHGVPQFRYINKLSGFNNHLIRSFPSDNLLGSPFVDLNC